MIVYVIQRFVYFAHWVKNPHFIKKSHFEIINFPTIHNFKLSFFTKFTFSKCHFSQNSRFQNLNFDKIHELQYQNFDKINIFKISFMTKFTFLKTSILTKFTFSKSSHFSMCTHQNRQQKKRRTFSQIRQFFWKCKVPKFKFPKQFSEKGHISTWYKVI